MARGSKAPASAQAQAVAREIRRELGEHKMSGRELARRIHRSETYVRQRISGEKPLDLNDLEDIAEVLGLDVIILLRKAEQAVSQVPANVINLQDSHPLDQTIGIAAHATPIDPLTEQEESDTP